MNSLEDTVQACAWPRSGLASLLVELLAGPGAQKTFSYDLPRIDLFKIVNIILSIRYNQEGNNLKDFQVLAGWLCC